MDDCPCYYWNNASNGHYVLSASYGNYSNTGWIFLCGASVVARKKYYIVEFRLPHEISEARTPEEAARKAATYFKNKFGIDLSAWYTRVFEFDDTPGRIGPSAEWFCNPQGTKFRKVDQNFKKHEDKVKKEKEND